MNLFWFVIIFATAQVVMKKTNKKQRKYQPRISLQVLDCLATELVY